MFTPHNYNNSFDNVLNWKKLYCNCCDEKLQMMSCEILSEYISGISFFIVVGRSNLKFTPTILSSRNKICFSWKLRIKYQDFDSLWGRFGLDMAIVCYFLIGWILPIVNFNYQGTNFITEFCFYFFIHIFAHNISNVNLVLELFNQIERCIHKYNIS